MSIIVPINFRKAMKSMHNPIRFLAIDAKDKSAILSATSKAIYAMRSNRRIFDNIVKLFTNARPIAETLPAEAIINLY